MMLANIIHTLVLVALFAFQAIYCVRVQFFKDHDFRNFLLEEEVDETKEPVCIDMKENSLWIGSLKTDKCLMIYNSKGCKSSSLISLRLEKDEPKLTCTVYNCKDKEEANHGALISSFHLCSDKLGGGSVLDVDFYDHDNPWRKPVSQFKNVCSCRNIPYTTKTVSLDNHGNKVEVFQEEHCQGLSRTMEAGRIGTGVLDPARNDMLAFNVRSFQPVGLQDCVQLKAAIYKIEYQNGTDKLMLPEKVKFGTNTVLRNNGSAKISQEYSASSKVSDTLTITESTGFSSMLSISLDASYEASVKGGVPFVAEGDSKFRVGTTLKRDRSTSGSKSNTSTISNDETISVAQRYEMPPCTECSINSFVNEVKGFPIEYKAYARVTGTAGGEKMRADEIKKNLAPKAEYLKDLDGYTVEIVVTDVMYANYGISVYIGADCGPISDCIRTYSMQSLADKTFEYVADIPRVINT